MQTSFSKLPSLARSALAAIALTTGTYGIAGAQTVPPGAALPPYATPATDQQIRGKISAITGKYTLQLRDERGYIDSVTLHQGTIITPTGLTLQPGMRVTITGVPEGATFAANQINTPYTVTVLQNAYPYYGAGFGWGPGWGWGWGAGWGWGPAYGVLWW